MAGLAGRWVPGTLTDWDDDRGFGFIVPDGGGRRVFVHVSAFPGGRRPVAGAAVTYVEGADDRGRPQARGARLGGAGPGRSTTGGSPRSSPGRRDRRRSPAAALVVGAGYLLALAALVPLDRVLVVLPAAVLVLSVVTFGTYAVDKSAARRGAQRVPETTLHVLAVVGGWPGALVAQRALRHKTIKQPFRSIFVLTVVLNVAAVAAAAYLVVAELPA